MVVVLGVSGAGADKVVKGGAVRHWGKMVVRTVVQST